MAIKEKREKLEEFLLDADNTQGKAQRRLFFKKKRGGVELTREQVKAIKQGRKKLRKELKARGIKSKEEFNLTASSLGLYFDKSRLWLLLGWLLHGRGLAALLGSLIALLGTIFLYASVTQLKGHFTINMSDGMFREGFVLSETADFANPTTHLFCEPAVDVPCISISHIPDDVDEYEGQHNESYFAYTFFVRNEGESTVGYNWDIGLNSESQDLSQAVWLMLFRDGAMTFYAQQGVDGQPEALPAVGENGRGYVRAPLIAQNASPDRQYEVVAVRNGVTYYRVIPETFVSDQIMAEGSEQNLSPGDVRKYTVVIWLEGDDPECTNELIGGHLGLELNLQLVSESSEGDGDDSTRQHWWDTLWSSLKFWDDQGGKASLET